MPVKESVTEESGFRMKPDSLIRSERRGLPTETARHLGQLHLTAAGDHLHHFARVVELLLRAAMSAPSGKDQRPWEFVVVNERPILDSLAAALPYAKMLAQAPCAVIVCGSPARSSYWYLDCSAAAENILLAAHSLGLGGVWTAAYPYAERMEAVRSNLALPEGILPLCVIPIGYPAAVGEPKRKFDAGRIHYNGW